MTKFWKPGDHVVRRGIAHNQVWIVHTMTVVEDSPEQTLLLLVPGAPCKIPSGLVQRKYSGSRDGKRLRWDEQGNPPWRLTDWVWQQRRFLALMRPGAYYAINMVWEDDSDGFVGWYVNFETPFRRSPVGFDTLDLELDLAISPDYSLHWKDTEEYEEGVRRGAISESAAKQIAVAKRDVLERIERRDAPFDGALIDWLPLGNWGVPRLPTGWNRLGY